MGPRLALVCAVVAAFWCSCAPAPRAYMVADAETCAALGGERVVTTMLGSSAGRGLEPHLALTSKEQPADAVVERVLLDAQCKAVIVLTTSALDVRGYALDHPGILFAAYGERTPVGPANRLTLVSGRQGAFQEAGRRVGLLVRESAGAKVGVLCVTPTSTAREEVDAFRKGLSEGGQEVAVLEREVRSTVDKSSAVRLLHEMREEGAGFFLLKTYGLTGACLEALAREGGKAVVEDCAGSTACGEEVVVSVETDWQRTMAAVFDAMGTAGDGWRATEIAEIWRLDERGGNGKRQ